MIRRERHRPVLTEAQERRIQELARQVDLQASLLQRMIRGETSKDFRMWREEMGWDK